jgi:hypothetical protein
MASMAMLPPTRRFRSRALPITACRGYRSRRRILAREPGNVSWFILLPLLASYVASTLLVASDHTASFEEDTGVGWL